LLGAMRFTGLENKAAVPGGESKKERRKGLKGEKTKNWSETKEGGTVHKKKKNYEKTRRKKKNRRRLQVG